jgi:hypothetical protein
MVNKRWSNTPAVKVSMFGSIFSKLRPTLDRPISNPMVAKRIIIRFIMIPMLRSRDSSAKIGLIIARPRTTATKAKALSAPQTTLINKISNPI